MADTLTKEQRSHVMSRVRSSNTKPELIVRKYLFAQGFRYRIHPKTLPGKPDIVLPKYHTVLFVHGCFWHYHSGCNRSLLPKSNVDFWANKFKRNVQRDEMVAQKLREQGWNVLVVYECQLTKLLRAETLCAISASIRASSNAQSSNR